ncbi:hypothetical protein BH24DEI2_BH24DEI2_01450 [soil metagenome]
MNRKKRVGEQAAVEEGLEATLTAKAGRTKVVRRYLAHELVGLLKSDVPYPGSAQEEQRLAAEAHSRDLMKDKS